MNKNVSPKLNLLFPTPVLGFSLNRKFTKEETAFFESERKKTLRNLGNSFTSSKDILSNKSMVSIKKFALSCLENYSNAVIAPVESVNLEIYNTILDKLYGSRRITSCSSPSK